MGAKLNNKTHLLNTFLDYLSRFGRIWFHSLQKVPQNYDLKIFLYTKTEESKVAEFYADFKSVLKNGQKI